MNVADEVQALTQCVTRFFTIFNFCDFIHPEMCEPMFRIVGDQVIFVAIPVQHIRANDIYVTIAAVTHGLGQRVLEIFKGYLLVI